jgi:hypothetical protein
MARLATGSPGFLVENNGEGLVLFARIEPYLETFRQATSPGSFRDAEGVATHYPTGQMLTERYRARVKRMLESRR